MITSFEVGAVFKIINEASPQLKKILEQVRALQKAIDKVKASMAEMTTALLPRGMASAIEQTNELAAAWGRVAEQSRLAKGSIGRASATAIDAPAAASRSTRNRGLMRPGARGGGGGNVHISSFGTHIPGGHVNFRGGGNVGMVAGGLMADAIYQGAELSRTARLAWWHSGLADTPGSQQQVRDIIERSRAESGFPLDDIGKSTSHIFRLLKGTPGNGLPIADELLRAGATEATLKETSLPEAVKSIIEQAHMMGVYDLEGIKKLAPIIGFLSTANPASLPQMVRSNSYSVPALSNALGMNAANVMFENTAIARAGATGSKSGTWVESAFENALPPDVNSMSKQAYARRMWALRKMGLIDADGKSTILSADGKSVDEEKFFNTARTHLDAMPIALRNSVEQAGFGKQGKRGFELMSSPSVMEQKRLLKQEVPDFIPKYNAFMDQMNEKDTIQKARTAYGQFNNLLADIGDKALPTVNKMLGDFKSLLENLSKVIPGGNSSKGVDIAARAAEVAIPGAALGAMVGGPLGAMAGGVGGGMLGAALAYMSQNGGLGIDKGGSYTSPGKTGKPAEPKVAVPPINLSINLDGRPLTQVVIDKLSELYRFDTNSPAFNGSSFFNGP